MKRQFDWDDGDPVRACGQIGKIELMPFQDTVSLLVLPLHEEFEAEQERLYHNVGELPPLHERMENIKQTLFRQNVHLKLSDVEDLIDVLQDYVAWRKSKG